LCPAAADSKKDNPPLAVEASGSMKILGFDKKTANDNGYDIRKDERGVEYSILASTPKGTMTGARYIPGQEPASGPEGISLLDTRYGDCGSSSLTGWGKNFSTAYAITNPWVGAAVNHTWRVAVSSSQGYQVYNLDGWAFSNSWQASRSISFRGWPYNGYVSNGTVYTSYGFVCGAMNPPDEWYGE
jgi:hypothetical protein